MEHPPYSPDLAPCDFFLFAKIKSALKGTRFESVDAVKANATQLLNSLTQNYLQHCFQQWKIRMERCRDRGGDYIEGDNISNVWFCFNKGLEHESGFFIATPRIMNWNASERKWPWGVTRLYLWGLTKTTIYLTNVDITTEVRPSASLIQTFNIIIRFKRLVEPQDTF